VKKGLKLDVVKAVKYQAGQSERGWCHHRMSSTLSGGIVFENPLESVGFHQTLIDLLKSSQLLYTQMYCVEWQAEFDQLVDVNG
jgi:hypothetical protein